MTMSPTATPVTPTLTASASASPMPPSSSSTSAASTSALPSLSTLSLTPSHSASASMTTTPQRVTPTRTPTYCTASACVGCPGDLCYPDSTCGSVCDTGFVLQIAHSFSVVYAECLGYGVCINATNPLARSTDYGMCWAVDSAGYCTVCPSGTCANVMSTPPTISSSPSTGASPSPSSTPAATPVASPSPNYCGAAACIGCSGNCFPDGTCSVDCDSGFVMQASPQYSVLWNYCEGDGLCIARSNAHASSLLYENCWAVDSHGYCTLCPDGLCDGIMQPSSPFPTPPISASPAMTSGTQQLSRSVSSTHVGSTLLSPSPIGTPVYCAASNCIGCSSGCSPDSTCSICDSGFVMQYHPWRSVIWNYCIGDGLCIDASNANALNNVYANCWAVNMDGYCTLCPSGTCDTVMLPTGTPSASATVSTGASPSVTPSSSGLSTTSTSPASTASMARTVRPSATATSTPPRSMSASRTVAMSSTSSHTSRASSSSTRTSQASRSTTHTAHVSVSPTHSMTATYKTK